VAQKELLTPDIKISEAILRLCEPLRMKYKDNNRLKVIISITVIAWNISVFPKEEQDKAQKILLKPLMKQLKGDEISVIFEQVKVLIERKNKYYPSIMEFILEHTLLFSNDVITLTVETADVPDEITRRVPLEASPKGDYSFKA
jgi:K+ transporter